MTRLVHWYEGMFMRVQSLQMMQQGMAERLDDIRRFQRHYPYGVLEAEVARDALETGKIRFVHLRAVLPNGLEVVVPDGCELPPFPVREELARSRSSSLTILLGVPDYGADHPNSFRRGEAPNPQAKLRYIPRDELRADENAGDNKQTVTVRNLNARLLFEHDDKTGLECLPLLRVSSRSGGTGTEFRVDVVREFVPPCLLLPPPPEYRIEKDVPQKSERNYSLPDLLAELVRQCVQQIERTRGNLGNRLQDRNLNMAALQGVQFRDWMRLMALSRNASRLQALQRSPNTTPFEMFLAFSETLSELETIRPVEKQGASRILAYDHDDPFQTFDRLRIRLEKALQDVEGREHRFVEFLPDPQRRDVVRAVLKPEFFGENVTAYYLTVETSRPVGELAKMLEDRKRFSLTTPRELGQSYDGLQLRHEPDPPAGLPDAPNLHYFTIEQSSEAFHQILWEKVKSARELAIDRDNKLAPCKQAEFKLYVTLRSSRTSDENVD